MSVALRFQGVDMDSAMRTDRDTTVPVVLSALARCRVRSVVDICVSVCVCAAVIA